LDPDHAIEKPETVEVAIKNQQTSGRPDNRESLGSGHPGYQQTLVVGLKLKDSARVRSWRANAHVVLGMSLRAGYSQNGYGQDSDRFLY
jgi:hypothetical protein